jgi:hypothetical protein
VLIWTLLDSSCFVGPFGVVPIIILSGDGL